MRAAACPAHGRTLSLGNGAAMGRGCAGAMLVRRGAQSRRQGSRGARQVLV